jgi:hypothetical protein
LARYLYIQCAAGPGPPRFTGLLDDWEIVVNCLSHRAFLHAVVSLGAASFLLLTAAGAYAGIGGSPADDSVVLTTEDAPEIRFNGSVMAPLVCTSTPDTSAVTIAENTRITLANLTGATASVDSGAAQALIVADGVGLSVRLRAGEYTIRMVPDCTVTNAVEAATITVKASLDPIPVPPATLPPILTDPGIVTLPVPIPSRTLTGTKPPATTVPDPSRSTPVTSPAVPSSPSVSPAPASTRPESPVSAGPGGPPASIGTPNTGPPGSIAIPAEPDPVIYDVLMVPVHQTGDPRDARLLAVIAVICVFGVTTAIIRAILSQRARRMVNT